MGRDETIDFSDVFLGRSYILFSVSFSIYFKGMESGPASDVHKEIQRKLNT